jgi:hypothetical protein
MKTPTQRTTREGEIIPDPEITSRLTTDGTKYLPETYESTDGTQEIPHPMMDPQGVRRKRQTDWPIGDPRRRDADFEPTPSR